MPEMHPSMRRLYDATGAAGQSALAKLFNVSPQRINNMETRGISKDLALRAQAEHGISATWLLDGAGPPQVAGSQPVTPDHEKLQTAIRFFDDLERSHPDIDISDATRHRIVTGVYLELLTTSGPNWVDITVRYTKILEAEAA